MMGFSVCAFAGTPTLEGVVKDATGKPVQGADVKIEPRTGGHFVKMIKTDATGRYVMKGLAAGTYQVTLLVNGQVKASILNASTSSSRATTLNFDLRKTKTPTKKHMVWVPAETGTHIGSGQWVEVDDSGKVDTNNSSLDHVNSAGVQEIQRTSMGTRSPKGP